MVMGKRIEPSDFELQVLGVLWERGEMTAREVMGALPDNKPRAYTSVLSVMQVMEKKGFLAHRLEGKTNIYRAKVTKGRVMGGVMGRLVDLVFGGKPTAVLQTLLEEKAVSAEELAEMRRVIEEKAKERRQ
jgi:predicted transcriptional regulator